MARITGILLPSGTKSAMNLHPNNISSAVLLISLEVDYSNHPEKTTKKKSVIAITAAEARALRRTDLKDMLDVDGLSAGDVTQLIEQSGPFTDSLILKNLAPWDLLKALEKQGFYVNTMIDESAKNNYTVIVWEGK